MARLLLARPLRRLARPGTPVDRLLRAIEGGTVGAVLALTRRLSPEAASETGGALVAFVGPRTRQHHLVERNLALAFPDRDPGWVRATARAVWRNVGRTLGEYPHLPRITGPELRERFELRCRFPPRETTRSGRGFVAVAMHQANWNLHAVAGALGGFPLDVVYAEQKNPSLEARIARWRDTMPCGFVHVRDTVRRGLALLRDGHWLGLFVDHRIDTGKPIGFFGMPAPTTIVPARLADRVGTGLVPVRLERLRGVRFRLTLEEPVLPDRALRDPQERAVDAMERVHRVFERWVRERPDEWFCIKRRWPKDIFRPRTVPHGRATADAVA